MRIATCAPLQRDRLAIGGKRQARINLPADRPADYDYLTPWMLFVLRLSVLIFSGVDDAENNPQAVYASVAMAMLY